MKQSIDDLNFDYYALYFEKDFSIFFITKCAMSDFKEVEQFGVIPNDSPKGYFNACVGKYTDTMATVYFKDLHKCPFDFYAERAYYEFEGKVFTRLLSKRCFEKLIPVVDDAETYAYYGIFKTKKQAIKAFEEKRKKYIMLLKKQLDSVSKIDISLQLNDDVI